MTISKLHHSTTTSILHDLYPNSLCTEENSSDFEVLTIVEKGLERQGQYSEHDFLQQRDYLQRLVFRYNNILSSFDGLRSIYKIEIVDGKAQGFVCKLSDVLNGNINIEKYHHSDLQNSVLNDYSKLVSKTKSNITSKPKVLLADTNNVSVLELEAEFIKGVTKQKVSVIYFYSIMIQGVGDVKSPFYTNENCAGVSEQQGITLMSIPKNTRNNENSKIKLRFLLKIIEKTQGGVKIPRAHPLTPLLGVGGVSFLNDKGETDIELKTSLITETEGFMTNIVLMPDGRMYVSNQKETRNTIGIESLMLYYDTKQVTLNQ